MGQLCAHLPRPPVLSPHKPFLKLSDADFTDQNLLRHRNGQVDGQTAVEPQVDVFNSTAGNQILAVDPEKRSRRQGIGYFVQRLRQGVFPPIRYSFYIPVVM